MKNNLIIIVFFFCIFCLFSFNLYNQVPIYNLNKDDVFPSNLSLSSYNSSLNNSFYINWIHIDTTNSNIPDNYISDITQSPDGEIWISTYKGFAKYLGQNQWLAFHNPNATSSDVCLAIKAQDSIIWVATVQGLVRYCNGNITVFDPTNSILPYYIYSLEVENDLLWIGTGGFGVYKYDGINFFNYSYLNTGNMPLGDIYYIAVDGFGVKWFSCMDSRPPGPNAHALVSFNNLSWSLFDSSNSSIKRYSYGISIDSLNNKWITDLEGHIQKFDDQLWTTFDSSNISYNPFFKSTRVAFDHFGNKWVSTSLGFAMYNDLTWSFYDSSNSPFPNEIIYTGSIYIDSTNTKFIGTNGKGLLIFNENGIDVSTNELEKNENDILLNGHFIKDKFIGNIIATNQKLSKIFIMDLNGQMIKSIFNNDNSNVRNSIYFEIDFSQYINGNYLLIVESFNKTCSFKIRYVQ